MPRDPIARRRPTRPVPAIDTAEVTAEVTARDKAAAPPLRWLDAEAATPVAHCVGVLTAAQDDGWRLRSGGVEARARRAASCLLEPAVGDTVACCLVAPDEAWITSILQREPGTADQWGSPRALRIASPDLQLSTDRLSVQAAHAEVGIDEARLVGRQWVLVGTAMKLVGTTLSTVFERVTHFAQHHLRHTEATDRVQARHIECEAGQLVRISGETTLIQGEKLVKARGGQIHFG